MLSEELCCTLLSLCRQLRNTGCRLQILTQTMQPFIVYLDTIAAFMSTKKSMMWPEVDQVKSQNKRELILDGSDVSKRIQDGGLDDEIYDLKEVNFLRISQTCLDVIDPKVSQLSENLTSLVLHHNKLVTLPDSLGELQALKTLDLSGNEFETLPIPVTTLKTLLSLNLSQNKITSLPDDMSGLANLHELYVTSNALSAIPESIGVLELLATIQADHNKIEELPESICQLQGLKALHLYDNILKDLPPSLVLLDKLKVLDVRGNKFKDRRLLKLANVEQTQPKGIFKHLKPLHDKQSGGAGGSKKGGQSGSKGAGDQEIEEITESIKVLHCADTKASGVEVKITEAAADVRPFIVCCILRNINLSKSTTTFKQFIAMQTRLHEGICEKRLVATIATHDLKAVKPCLTYDARNPAQTMLVPLGRQKPISSAEFMKKLQKEAEDQRKAKKRNTTSGIHKYLDLMKGKTVYPFLLDNDDNVISFPPITNCESTKISAETTDILLEVTSSKSLLVCKQVMEELIKDTLTLAIGSSEVCDSEEGTARTGNHLIVEQVKVTDITSGHLKTVYPSRADLVDIPYHVERE